MTIRRGSTAFVARPLVACLALAAGATGNPQSVAAAQIPDGVAPPTTDETLILGPPKSGLGKVATPVGDYATVVHRCCWQSGFADSDYDHRNDVATTWTRYSVEVATGAGPAAKVKARTGSVDAVEYPEGSFAAEVLDEVIDEAFGIEIFGGSDRPVYTRMKTLLRAEITTTTAPGETWRVKAEKFRPSDELRHAPGLWGVGALTNGARTLKVTYSNAPPFDEKKCDEMIRARDDHRWACYGRQITEISENGAWLASYDSYARAYAFRAGLGEDLKLPILAALEAMRTNGTPQGF